MLSGLINTSEKTMVPIDQIKADGGTQMRAGLDDGTVAEYADFFRESRQWGDFPPVVLYHDGADYWLADGFHRVAAWKRAGNAVMGAIKIPADVRSGTRRDAILYAAGANANHGLRRTNADKRRAVEVMLRDEEWSKWSDAEIARRCSVSPMTVGRIRSELIYNNVIDAPRERTVQRGGQTYTQKTANIGANLPISQSPNPQSPTRRYESGLPALKITAPSGRLPLAPGAERPAPAPSGRLPLAPVTPNGAPPPIEPPIAVPLKPTPDDRITKAVRLIDIYNLAISTLDEYGNLIGAHLETLAAKRELEKLIRHLERECALLEGRTVEPLEACD